jgi:hypothetical protein
MENLDWVLNAKEDAFINFDTSKISPTNINSVDRWPYLERNTFINKVIEYKAYNVIECLFISITSREWTNESHRCGLIKSEIFSSILRYKHDGYKELFIKYYNKYYRGGWNILDMLLSEPELLDYTLKHSGYDRDETYRVLVLAAQNNNLEVVKICIKAGMYDHLDMALVQAIRYSHKEIQEILVEYIQKRFGGT